MIPAPSLAPEANGQAALGLEIIDCSRQRLDPFPSISMTPRSVKRSPHAVSHIYLQSALRAVPLGGA